MKKFENAITEIMKKYEAKELKYNLAIDKLYAVLADTEGPQKELGYYLIVKEAEPLTESEKLQIKKKVLESVIEIMENRIPRLRSPYSIRNAKNRIENLKSEIRQLTKEMEKAGYIEKENIFLNPDELTSEQEDAYLDFKELWDAGVREREVARKEYKKMCKKEMRILNVKYFDDIFDAFQKVNGGN